MTENEAVLEQVFDTVYASNADTEGTWVAALGIATVALRRADGFTRERLLRSVERELRNDLAGIEKMLEAENNVSS